MLVVCSSGLSALAVCLSELLCTKFLSRGCKSSCACGQQNQQTFWNKKFKAPFKIVICCAEIACSTTCSTCDMHGHGQTANKAPPIGGPIIGGNMGPRFGIPLPSKVRHNVWMIHWTSCLALREIDLAYKTAIRAIRQRIYHLKFKNI